MCCYFHGSIQDFFSLSCFSSFIMCLDLDFFWFNLFGFQWTSQIYKFMSFTKLGAFFSHWFFFFFQILPALHSLPSICGTLINLAPLFKEKGSLFLEFQVPKSSVALAVIATTTTVGLSGGWDENNEGKKKVKWRTSPTLSES